MTSCRGGGFACHTADPATFVPRRSSVNGRACSVVNVCLIRNSRPWMHHQPARAAGHSRNMSKASVLCPAMGRARRLLGSGALVVLACACAHPRPDPQRPGPPMHIDVQAQHRDTRGGDDRVGARSPGRARVDGAALEGRRRRLPPPGRRRPDRPACARTSVRPRLVARRARGARQGSRHVPRAGAAFPGKPEGARGPPSGGRPGRDPRGLDGPRGHRRRAARAQGHRAPRSHRRARCARARARRAGGAVRLDLGFPRLRGHPRGPRSGRSAPLRREGRASGRDRAATVRARRAPARSIRADQVRSGPSGLSRQARRALRRPARCPGRLHGGGAVGGFRTGPPWPATGWERCTEACTAT